MIHGMRLKKQHEHIRLFGVLPSEGHEEKWEAELKERYYKIIGNCTRVKTISKYHNAKCIDKRNQYIIDHVGLVFAVYDGREEGRTASYVEYAKAKGKVIQIIHPETLAEISHGDISFLKV